PAARQRRRTVLLDGFVCVAAVAPLAKLRADALAHALAAHVSAEAEHRMLLSELRLAPLLDLGMRLGEGSGAAVAVSVLRAALACHPGMSPFAEAGGADQPRLLAIAHPPSTPLRANPWKKVAGAPPPPPPSPPRPRPSPPATSPSGSPLPPADSVA